MTRSGDYAQLLKALCITCCALVDLKPDTEYEMQVRGKNAAGVGEAAYLKTRTNSKGDSGKRTYIITARRMISGEVLK